MIDTHTHIYLEEFNDDRHDTMTRALEAGVRHMILPNVDCSTVRPLMELHQAFPHCTSAAMGLHPTEVGADYHERLAEIKTVLDDGDFVAVGEVGIDLYWDKTFRLEQMKVLEIQLKWALEKSLPVIIHCRDGFAEIIEVLARVKSECGSLPQCVFHSFTGTQEDLHAVRDCCDAYFGINGIVTFKKSHLPALLPEIGLNRILLETDSPYLAPVPNRGKRNESANIPYINHFIAATLGLTDEAVSAATDANAAHVFNLTL